MHLDSAAAPAKPLNDEGDELRPGLTLIVPCYNAEKYLGNTIKQLAELFIDMPDLELIVVNDGSDESCLTDNIISAYESEPPFEGRIKYLSHPFNQGKGAAIITGLAAVQTNQVCYTDADLAYTPDNIPVLRDCLAEDVIVIANRVDRHSTFLIQPHYFHYIASRHVASRLFNLVVRLTLIAGVRDVQAGLKMAHTKDLRKCVSKITRLRFSFDTELLFIAVQRGMRIHSSPVRYKYLSEASTVSFLLDSVIMARDLVLIRIYGWLGRYS